MRVQKKITELIDMKLLQKIQDNCSKAMGFAFVTVDYKGNPVSQYSGFTKHCMKVRESQGLYEMCALCDAHGGLHSAITGQPYIYRCHADLVDFALPLIVDGNYVGAVLGGQARMREEEANQLEYILSHQSTLCRDNPEIRALRESMEYVTYERMEAAVTVLRDILVTLMKDTGNEGMEHRLEETEQELNRERMARAEMEMAMEKKDREAAQWKTSSAFFYFVMNIISRLAYEEKAVKTEEVVYDFTDMTRYLSQGGQGISTLGEEVQYIQALLRVQKAWLQDDLDYQVSVPKSYWGISCPWMLLHPVVERMLAAHAQRAGKLSIQIHALEEDRRLRVVVGAKGSVQTADLWNTWINNPQELGPYSLYEANSRLKSSMGEECDMKVISHGEEGQIQIQFTLLLDQ